MPTTYEVRETDAEANTGLTKNCMVKLRKQVRSDKVAIVFAEFLGTAALVFFGCMAAVDWIGLPALPIQTPMTFGLTVHYVIQAIGHISYALINPAITIVAVINELITIKFAIILMVAQTLGATVGYGILMVVTPNEFLNFPEGQGGLCVTLPFSTMSVMQAFAIEFFLTATLAFVVSGAWDPRNRELSDSVPLRIGFTVMALSLAGGLATGASMNPARSFGPAIWNWNWNHHWLYWVAPMLGATLAGLLYRSVFWRQNPKDEIIEEPIVNQIDNK